MRKMKIQELKNKVSEIKISLGGINSRTEKKRKVSEFVEDIEDILKMDQYQLFDLKNRKMKDCKENSRHLWKNNTKMSNITG